MQVTHFLKRKNCKVSLHFVKYKETGKPVSADGPLITAVAKTIMLRVTKSKRVVLFTFCIVDSNLLKRSILIIKLLLYDVASHVVNVNSLAIRAEV